LSGNLIVQLGVATEALNRNWYERNTGQSIDALTYARRYALFTLVGIAGEDDLDAPDLPKDSSGPSRSEPPTSNGRVSAAVRSAPNGGRGPVPSKSVLPPEQSATLGERLVVELAALTSTDEAAAWAHRNLPVKNTLTANDALLVEEGFQRKLAAISDPQATSSSPNVPGQKITSESEANPSADGSASRGQIPSLPKKRSRKVTVGPLGKAVRLRDKDHRKFVMRQACLVCGRVPSDPHHLRFTQPRALGRTVSDEFIVPICRLHHRELHRSGDEAAWWQKLNIDPVPVALRLWQQTQAGPSLTETTKDVTEASNLPAPSAQGPDLSRSPPDQQENLIPQSTDGIASR
jgi:hypothetical protein